MKKEKYVLEEDFVKKTPHPFLKMDKMRRRRVKVMMK